MINNCCRVRVLGGTWRSTRQCHCSAGGASEVARPRQSWPPIWQELIVEWMEVLPISVWKVNESINAESEYVWHSILTRRQHEDMNLNWTVPGLWISAHAIRYNSILVFPNAHFGFLTGCLPLHVLVDVFDRHATSVALEAIQRFGPFWTLDIGRCPARFCCRIAVRDWYCFQ